MSVTATSPLYTIGYEGKTPASLVDVLRAKGIRRVADVRYLPLSRKRGFSKTALAERLRENGIEYLSLRQLGTTPGMRKQYKQTWNFEWLASEYRNYLQTQRTAVAELYAVAAEGGCCLLCFERDPATCHRSLLAEEVKRHNGREFSVTHL